MKNQSTKGLKKYYHWLYYNISCYNVEKLFVQGLTDVGERQENM